LSQQITLLEKIIGAKLFDRNSRSVSLSGPGRLFMKHAKQAVDQADLAQEMGERAGCGELGTINIAYAGSTLYSGLLSSLVHTFHRLYPDVAISIVEESIDDQLSAIADGSIDVGILRTPIVARPGKVEIRTILKEPVVLALREDHRLAKTSVIEIGDLRSEAIISSQPDDVGIIKTFLSATARSGFNPYIIRARHFGAIMSLVSAGLGVAPVPQSANVLQLPGIAYVPLVGIDLSEIAIAYRQQSSDPVTHAFIDLAKKQIG
jgi:DNA-binding transcriptional LysR family regulator